MKYLKQYINKVNSSDDKSLYESLNTNLKVGDYVIMNTNTESIEVLNFIKNNIGIITDIYKDALNVQYNNIPENIKIAFNKSFYNKYTREFRQSQIIAHGKTPEEIQLKLDANKFNL